MKCKEQSLYNDETMNILIKIVNRNELNEMIKNQVIACRGNWNWNWNWYRYWWLCHWSKQQW